MKKTILILLVSLFCGSTYSQVTPNDSKQETSPVTEDIFYKSDYVFEGVIIKVSTYKRAGKSVMSEIVKITKVFRGKLNLGTVEILNHCAYFSWKSPTEDRSIYSNKELKDTLGIFFCKKHKVFSFDSKYDLDVVDNKILLNGYYDDGDLPGDRIILRLGYGYRSYGVPTPKGRYWTKEEVYQVLRKYPKLKIPSKPEPEPVDSRAIPIEQAISGHHYTKRERDSLFRIDNPNVILDSTGTKVIGYKRRLKKVKNDSIYNSRDTSNKAVHTVIPPIR